MDNHDLSPSSSSRRIIQGTITSLRDAPPTHYKIKIQSFSEFLNTIVDKYESAIFEAGGYKWRLILYPNGNLQRNGEGHISLYLAVAEAQTLPVGWELNVTFKMFVYDHNLDKYLTLIQDDNGRGRHLHDMKTECGIDNLLPLNVFKDPSKGYLVDDTCIFGVEVLVAKYSGKGERMSIITDPPRGTFTWTINKFASRCIEEQFKSELFTLSQYNWYLSVYPKGDSSAARDKYLSVYLWLNDLKDFPPGSRLYVEGTLVMKNHANADLHISKQIKRWFDGSTSQGYAEFIPLADLNDKSKGYIVNDSIVLECKLTKIMSVMKYSI